MNSNQQLPKKVIVVIPTYNEAAIIELTVLNVLQHTADLPSYKVEVLVFDSNSTDATASIIQNMQQKHQGIHFASEPEKSGLGSAYYQALKYAIENLGADIVFEYDADGSHRPQHLPEMLTEFSRGADVVVGSRYVPGGSIPSNWGFHRKLMSVFGNVLARTVLTPKYKDFTSGFRGTRASFMLKALEKPFLSKQYAYKMHLFWRLHKLKAKIVESPIQFIDRELGFSKFPKNNIVDSLRVIFTLRLLEMKRFIGVCLVGGIGACVNFAIFNVLRLHFHPLFSSLVSVEMAIISNFILNNNLTFRSVENTRGKKGLLSKFLRFNLFSSGSILLQSASLSVGLYFFGRGIWVENGFVLLGIMLGTFSNYFLYSRLIWSNKNIKTKEKDA